MGIKCRGNLSRGRNQESHKTRKSHEIHVYLGTEERFSHDVDNWRAICSIQPPGNDPKTQNCLQNLRKSKTEA